MRLSHKRAARIERNLTQQDVSQKSTLAKWRSCFGPSCLWAFHAHVRAMAQPFLSEAPPEQVAWPCHAPPPSQTIPNGDAEDDDE